MRDSMKMLLTFRKQSVRCVTSFLAALLRRGDYHVDCLAYALGWGGSSVMRRKTSGGEQLARESFRA